MTSQLTRDRVHRSRLCAHPDNANRMPDDVRGKIVQHLKVTGLYAPLIVRSLELSEQFAAEHTRGLLQKLDGHQRDDMIEEAGIEPSEMRNVEVWHGIDDARAVMLIATFNDLHGMPDPEAQAALMRRVHELTGLSAAELAAVTAHREEDLRAMLELSPAERRALGTDDDTDPAPGGDGGADYGDPSAEAEPFTVWGDKERIREIKEAIKARLKDDQPMREGEHANAKALADICAQWQDSQP